MIKIGSPLEAEAARLQKIADDVDAGGNAGSALEIRLVVSRLLEFRTMRVEGHFPRWAAAALTIGLGWLFGVLVGRGLP